MIAPQLSLASDILLASNTQGLPDDFKQYLYNSELLVQVYLNDMRLFDASVLMKEDGHVRLIKTINDAQDVPSETLTRWRDFLKDGVSVGKCTGSCASGLMEIEYRFDNSVLKIYTSKYENDRVQSNYISMPEDTPNGIIMNNYATLTDSGSTRSWGLNSSLTSSFLGWSQKASFQSTGTEGEYHYDNSSLYELYTQKELQGSFIRLGFFTPDGDTGNVQMSGFGYDTVVGAMWGSSDSLLISSASISARPVYVTGRNQSIAEVWRDGRLIHTQQLQAGVQALDTRQLPGGIYDITIKIIENGRSVDTQQAQIFKPLNWRNQDRRWRMNLWSGQHRTLETGSNYTQEDNPFSFGGGVDILAHPRAILGLSGAVKENEHHIRTRANVTLTSDDTLFAQYTFGNNEYYSNQNTDIRYYRNIPGGGSASLFWNTTTTDLYGHRTYSRRQGDTWGSTLSLRLPWSTYLTVNGQYMKTDWRRGFGVDMSVNSMVTLAGRNMNFRVSAYDRPGFNDEKRDYGLSFGINVSLAPIARHSVSAEVGLNQDQGYSNLSYQWNPGDNSSIRTLGAGVSYSQPNTVFSGNASIDTPYISGDGYIQHNTEGSSNSLGVNMSQTLVMGGGYLAPVNGYNNNNLESAIIVDVDSESDTTDVLASSSMSELQLNSGRNVIPAGLWKKEMVQFSASNGKYIHVSPSSEDMQMRRGSVKYIKVKAVKTRTIIAMLQDTDGNVLKNRYVSSDVSSGVINSEGVLTLDSGTTNRKLMVREDAGLPAMICDLPAGLDKEESVLFVSIVKCRKGGLGENK